MGRGPEHEDYSNSNIIIPPWALISGGLFVGLFVAVDAVQKHEFSVGPFFGLSAISILAGLTTIIVENKKKKDLQQRRDKIDPPGGRR